MGKRNNDRAVAIHRLNETADAAHITKVRCEGGRRADNRNRVQRETREPSRTSCLHCECSQRWLRKSGLKRPLRLLSFTHPRFLR